MQNPMQGHSVTLVLGGVRSGKSRFAQHLAERSSRVLFVATAEAREDEEMRLKIERHRTERPATWITVEEPLQLPRVLADAADTVDVILIDCLTLYAANLLEACGDNASRLQTHIQALSLAVLNADSPVILVSNEVGSGVVPEYALGRRFRDLLGEINQRIAAHADTVLLMVAGLPLALKGAVPRAVQL